MYKFDIFSQEPVWDCEVDFTVPDGQEKAVNIEVFDADKFGKDKSLGIRTVPKKIYLMPPKFAHNRIGKL